MNGAARYYDVRAILAEEERVPVRFNTGVRGLGRQLNPSASDENLAEGSGVELPMWLVPHLATRNMLRVKLRKCFGERTRRELEAGAGKVVLRDQCRYYYTLGSSLCALYVSNLLYPPWDWIGARVSAQMCVYVCVCV